MGDTITLTRDGGDWYATWGGREGREMIRDLGTNVVPTPYRDTVPAERVRAAIQERNPHNRVVVQTFWR